MTPKEITDQWLEWFEKDRPMFSEPHEMLVEDPQFPIALKSLQGTLPSNRALVLVIPHSGHGTLRSASGGIFMYIKNAAKATDAEVKMEYSALARHLMGKPVNVRVS